MKDYIECNIISHRKEKFFFSIRNKLDYILLILDSVEDFLNMYNYKGKIYEGKIVIKKGRKSRRIYFESRNKVFSVFFPFDFLEEDGEVKFRYTSNNKITYEIEYGDLSYIRSIIYNLADTNNESNNQELGIGYSLGSIFDYLCSPDIGITSALMPKIGELLYGLLSCEDGYIRYDHDEKNEGCNHPLHHIDICYDDKNTYKIGLHRPYSYAELNELLDNSFQRKYLS